MHCSKSVSLFDHVDGGCEVVRATFQARAHNSGSWLRLAPRSLQNVSVNTAARMRAARR